ncbi:MAG: hypothetical protein OXF56_14490 [Rhodobacteraceae bacterium]|nr:hypothetical protein [Paracoccaceae bacterium]
MTDDGFEPGAKMLARLDQDVALARRVEAGVGKATGVERLVAALAVDNLNSVGVAHRSTIAAHIA